MGSPLSTEFDRVGTNDTVPTISDRVAQEYFHVGFGCARWRMPGSWEHDEREGVCRHVGFGGQMYLGRNLGNGSRDVYLDFSHGEDACVWRNKIARASCWQREDSRDVVGCAQVRSRSRGGNDVSFWVQHD